MDVNPVHEDQESSLQVPCEVEAAILNDDQENYSVQTRGKPLPVNNFGLPGGATEAVLAGGLQALAGNLDATAKLQSVQGQLQTAMNEYSQVFLPAKEKAGQKLDNDLKNFDRLYPVRFFGVACMALLALVFGVLLVEGASSAQPLPGILIVVELLLVVVVVVKLAIIAARRSARSAKKKKLMKTWDRWNRDETERRTRIAMLEERLRTAKE